MTTTGPSTLRERIAALQQRGTSPQPTSPPRSQTPTGGPPKAGGGGLRDKIARFEQKGGTPIPRGSFGLGAPLQQGGKRNNELWGNRIPSAGRSSDAGTASLGRSASLSVGSSGRARCVSVSEAQLGSLQKLQDDLRTAPIREPVVPEDAARESDMINSLDIATHTPTSPSFNAAFPTSPAKRTSLRLEEEPSAVSREESRNEPSVEVSDAPIVPASPPPPIIVIREEEDTPQLTPASSTSNENYLEVDPPVDEPEIDSYTVFKAEPDEGAVNNPPIPTSSAISERPSSPHIINVITSDGSHSSGGADELIFESSSASSEQAVPTEIQISPPPENRPIDPVPGADAVASPPAVSQSPLITAEEVPGTSVELDGESSAHSNDFLSTIPSPEDTSPSSIDSMHAPYPVDLAPSAYDRNLVTHSQVQFASEDELSPFNELIPPTPPPKDSSFSIATQSEPAPVEGSPGHTHDLTPPGPKDTLWGLDTTTAHNIVFSEHPSHSESASAPSSVTLDSPVTSRTPPSIAAISNLAVPESAPQSPTTSVRGDAPFSVASSSMSEASNDSPHVTPILDAFPAVPRYLPPTSPPTRARTISGHTRSVTDRSSGSSTSSIKSTPSLSFSSTSSSTCSPTSTINNAPLAPNPRLPASGLQRSKSQTTRARPISSVPAWYDDDSDEGEVGWANVVVTTRRYY